MTKGDHRGREEQVRKGDATRMVRWRPHGGLALAAVYLAAGLAGLQLVGPRPDGVALWLPSGIGTVALLLWGGRLWPGVMLGSVCVNFWIVMATGKPVGAVLIAGALITGAGAALQAVAITHLVRRRFGTPIDLHDCGDVLVLALLIGPLGCAIAPAIRTLAALLTGFVPVPHLGQEWLVWWASVMLGTAAVAPLAMISPLARQAIRWRGEPVLPIGWPMIAALLLLLTATLSAWKMTGTITFDRQRAVFEALTRDSETALNNRLTSYGQSLDGGAALLAASDQVNAIDWRTYVDRLDIDRTLPGILGLGLIVPVNGPDRAAFSLVRASETPGFAIHPPRPAAQSFVISLIEPLARNRVALGLDIGFEPHRRSAAIHARDTGRSTITRRIFLVQDGQRRPSFLLLRPVYRTTAPPSSTAARRAAFRGWVYAPFMATRFMAGLTNSQGQNLDIRIVDGAPGAGSALIYDSKGSSDHIPRFRVTRSIRLMEQQWTLTWTSTPAFEASMLTAEAWLVLGGGLTVTLLFAALFLSNARREAYVRQQVETQTSALLDREEGLQQAIQALRESERHFSALAALSPAGIFRTDEFGFCNFVNDAWLRTTGQSQADADGLGWMAAIHPQDRERVRVEWRESMRTGRTMRAEVRFQHRNGAVHWVDLITGPETDDGGCVIGIIGVGIDISARKRLEEDMANARHRAEQATQAKTVFLAKMSHEIRTPMNGVMGFAELLLQDDLPSAQRAKVAMILESSRTMMELLNDILDFTKIEAGHMHVLPERISIRSKLDGCVAMLDPLAARKGLPIHVEIGDDLPEWIMVDPLRLRQIVVNLLGNAIKFTDWGEIRVSAFRDSNGLLAVQVQDSGIGIASERQAAIFEHFVQADESAARKHGGTGLGLAICAQLARLLGGKLELRSDLGQGTTVTLRIPLVTAEAAEREDIASPPRLPRRQLSTNKRILLVEDHDINRMLIRQMLERLGYEPAIAIDGGEAIAMVTAARARGAPFHLVLMDIQMPSMDGREAARRLRSLAITPTELPIVALSANAYADDVAQCLAAGMQDHLAKPVQLHQLDDLLTRFLGPAAPGGEAADARSDPTLLERYVERRAQTCAALAQAAQGIPDAATMERLRVMLHQLAGTAGAFGDDALGRCARDLQHHMPHWPQGEWRERLIDARLLLVAAMEQGCAPGEAGAFAQEYADDKDAATAPHSDLLQRDGEAIF